MSLLSVGLALIALGVLLTGHWLYRRLTAVPCPRCGSRWRTELTGEWDGEEDWTCNRCGHAWGERFAPPYSGGAE